MRVTNVNDRCLHVAVLNMRDPTDLACSILLLKLWVAPVHKREILNFDHDTNTHAQVTSIVCFR